jgi:alpha-1,3-rhamnosyl/mannosyltransferase
MRIGIDASLGSMLGTGTGRYATRLVQHLLALDRENEYVLYFRERDRGRNPLFPPREPRIRWRVTDAPLTLLRLHLNLPLWLRRDRVDVYHSLGFFLPLLWRGPSLVTIHDIHPVLFGQYWRNLSTRTSYLALRAHIPLALRQASCILTPSRYVKQSIRDRFRVPARRIAVTPHGVDQFFLEPPTAGELAAAEARFGAAPFFLYVGVLAPHKNLTGLVRAFARLSSRAGADGIRLIIVGKPSGRYRRAELVPLIRSLGLTGRVILAGFVDDALLRALYRRALALVLPSFAEGFGLPLLEAMASGTPILTSLSTAMPEVAGNAALYVDPEDPGEIAAGLERLSGEPALRRRLAAIGATRALSFSWEQTAREVLSLYREPRRVSEAGRRTVHRRASRRSVTLSR